MRNFIKGWWHVGSAILAGLWIMSTGVFGWVGDVNASIRTTTQLEETAVRKDVLNETMKRIEAELRTLNKNFETHMDEGKHDG